MTGSDASITALPTCHSLPAVICGKWTSLVGRSLVTVRILYSESHIYARNLPVMSRSQPVIAGSYLETGGAVRCR